ncbi:hypothetical protein LCGC14_1331170 [marine sediment metagenome]|uniref:Uncharacterized protein n=1 Tax=marine sediment metagenome TaxID=412755 RepID=A0A0F9KHA5_9ZZZZ
MGIACENLGKIIEKMTSNEKAQAVFETNIGGKLETGKCPFNLSWIMRIHSM